MGEAFSLIRQIKAVKRLKTWLSILFLIKAYLLSAVFYLSRLFIYKNTEYLFKSGRIVSADNFI